ncbi:MAG: ABC transporter ATP-binding protein [Bacteroidales bacterium]|jgi:zinc transport system ATP-binding protein|nr:ABC transporter ATP-binding protein [Bacteroidales bacterium]
MAVLIEMQSLTAAYENNVVLEDVNFTVNDGDYIGVIGPNGGGKTTLLKVILGLLKPVRGKLVFNTAILNRNATGYLPQIPTGDVNYPVNVLDTVLSGLMIHKSVFSRMTAGDRKKAEGVIDSLGLKAFARTPLNELSGGQLQRVFLGRAVIGNPKLLLLDEPANFVDSSFENDFYEHLKELNRRMAILMVSHNVGAISSHIKSFACVNRRLHYHPSHEITGNDLLAYNCPIQIVSHGNIPHTILKTH